MFEKICHDQVKILLERMDTNPEEFVTQEKWDAFLPPENPARTNLFKHFTKVEQFLIRRKYNKIIKAHRRQRTYDRILETLMFKEESSWSTVGNYTSSHPVLGTPIMAGRHANALREELGN